MTASTAFYTDVTRIADSTDPLEIRRAWDRLRNRGEVARASALLGAMLATERPTMPALPIRRAATLIGVAPPSVPAAKAGPA